MSPLDQKVSSMLLGKSGGQLLIAPERTKSLGLKQKCLSVADVSGGESKVQCCKEQYCIGTWNIIRSMNQGKLEVIKSEMVRVNLDILEISKLKWTGMGEFNSDDHYIYYCGQKFLRRNRVAIVVNKRVRNWMQSQKRQNDLFLFPRQTIQ